MTADVFNPIFWAHWPPEIQLLQTIDNSMDREGRAVDLASKGFPIDVPIMVWGWGAYQCMIQRIQSGYTVTPTLLAPSVQTAPGFNVIGLEPYNPVQVSAAGGIKVSLDVADWPPWAAPPKTAIPAGATNVGQIILFRVLATIAEVNPAAVPFLMDGDTTKWDGSVWRIHKDLSGFMGVRCWAELIGPISPAAGAATPAAVGAQAAGVASATQNATTEPAMAPVAG